MRIDDLARAVACRLQTTRTMGADWETKMEDIRPDYSRVAIEAAPAMINVHRTIHGGAIFARAGTAFDYARNLDGQQHVVRSAMIKFINLGYRGERLIAEVQRSRRPDPCSAHLVGVRASDPWATFRPNNSAA